MLQNLCYPHHDSDSSIFPSLSQSALSSVDPLRLRRRPSDGGRRPDRLIKPININIINTINPTIYSHPRMPPSVFPNIRNRHGQIVTFEIDSIAPAPVTQEISAKNCCVLLFILGFSLRKINGQLSSMLNALRRNR